MKLALIGLGRMGLNMVKRMVKGGHEVVAFNRSPEPVQEAAAAGAIAAASLEDAVSKLSAPRVVWLMLPAGDVTEKHLTTLMTLLSPGDLIVDGGNSNFHDTMRRAAMLREKNIYYVDVGTSGGIWGLAEGYSMMVGGEKAAVEILRPALETLAPAPDQGWGHMGPSGSGHYVKMVHNGIEYGMMQAYAEGFEIMRARKEFNLDLYQIAEVWRFGSVVRSWLLDLTANALKEDQELSDLKGYVADSGEGRWTVFEAIDQDVPAPVITLSLQMRFRSRQDDSYAGKLLAAMRNQFGGHAVKKNE
ncbi:MAG TPA: decarboxylating 6-phosphogluconate dehydrogenase [Aggregatilineales bacterium]|nr:decarboxylating 6-phosphogluconate dehydrogenase [Anaerolineales bacterium]HRE48204.1 decarboxylating 6-phosphogluconate dehydrogenase [Aggregatilineales bacterium]